MTNTVGQVLLFEAFGIPLPIYWHMPILCNTEGKKLSKRDFGFSLRDLRTAGFLPEAITNYLAIIGGSYEQEIMDLDELVKSIDFSHTTRGGHITYDVNKLKWVNHKWIERLELADLAQRCRPFLEAVYPSAKDLDAATVEKLIGAIRTDMTTLTDCVEALQFYFQAPSVTAEQLKQHYDDAHHVALRTIITDAIDTVAHPERFVEQIKVDAKQQNIPLKELFSVIRIALTGQPRGLGIHVILDVLGAQESARRLSAHF